MLANPNANWPTIIDTAEIKLLFGLGLFEQLPTINAYTGLFEQL